MSKTEITKLINIDPELMSGTPVFMGSRVPVQSLFDWLDANYPLDEWLDNFPSVTREQAQAALTLSSELLLAQAQQSYKAE